MAVLYDEWLACNENWKSSNYLVSLRRQHAHEKSGARRWMTYKQIIEKYSGDITVADSIVEGKKNDPVLAKSCIKPHPDCPQRPEPLPNVEVAACAVARLGQSYQKSGFVSLLLVPNCPNACYLRI